MRSRRLAFLVLFIFFMFSMSILLSSTSSAGLIQVKGSRILSPAGSDPSYSENMQLYLTSSEAFWRIDMAGGNISVSSVNVPSSVSGYSITLTAYSSWKTQFELFGRYGFGLLGSNEPSPDGAFLQINSTSLTDAEALASSLSQRFALNFTLLSQGASSYLFFSPSNFITEMHVFFWQLVPSSYGGFASLFTEQQFDANTVTPANLLYYRLLYSGSSSYVVSIGQLLPLVGTSFTLYGQLGLTCSICNFSSSSSSSTIGIHLFGGLISNSSVAFTNHPTNFSASIYTSKQNSNMTMPNVKADLELQFPTIIAYRQVSSLTPSHDQNVSVSIVVKDISPSGYPNANDIAVNDSWIYPASKNGTIDITVPQTVTKQNLTSSGSFTDAYAFTVLANSGAIPLPATQITYQFSEGNQTVNGVALLNPETLVVGASNTPELEATEAISSGSIQAGQTSTFNITVSNKGNGIAFNVRAAGLVNKTLPAGSSWTFSSNSSSASLTQTNANVSYPVSWSDSSNKNHTASTNTISAVFSFGTPATPGTFIQKSVNYFQSMGTANVTLSIFDSSSNPVSNVTVKDMLPEGVTWLKSYNSSSLQNSGRIVSGNISSLSGNSNATFVYSVNITNPVETYIFLPANVSSTWNSIMITHQSSAFLLPLGIQPTKQISPTQAFQGSNVNLTLSLTNKGSLPIYFVSLNDTSDTFLNVTKYGSSYSALLDPNESMSPAHLVANLTGGPGSYNSSSAVATFILSGYNESTSSLSTLVTIYHLPEANLTATAEKFEESHDIQVTVTILNPSNVTVTDLTYSLSLPSGLSLKAGNPNFTTASLGPGAIQTQSFTVLTNQPNTYNLNKVSLTFAYQGVTLRGIAGTLSLSLGDDLTTRYAIPILIAIVIALASVFYVRRITRKPPVTPAPVSTKGKKP